MYTMICKVHMSYIQPYAFLTSEPQSPPGTEPNPAPVPSAPEVAALALQGCQAQPLMPQCPGTRNFSTPHSWSRSELPVPVDVSRDMCESSCMMYDTASGRKPLHSLRCKHFEALYVLKGWYKSRCSSLRCTIIFCPVHAAQSCIQQPPTHLQLFAPC